MKAIIAGSRDLKAYSNHEKVWLVADAVMKSGWRNQITEVVSGHARGIDKAGELWAESVGIPHKRMPPEYDKYPPKVAPKVRNQAMADYCNPYGDALILIWDGVSRGSADMKERALKRGLKIYEYIVQ